MKITQKFIESLLPHTAFAAGVAWDTDEIKITGKRQLLGWVAVRGATPDWAVYVGQTYMTFDRIAVHGSKTMRYNALLLVDCDDDAANSYRA